MSSCISLTFINCFPLSNKLRCHALPQHGSSTATARKRPATIPKTPRACAMSADADSSPEQRYFATCARGLGEVVAEELQSHMINATIDHVAASGVQFRGRKQVAYAACLWLRTAMRVIERLDGVNVSEELTPAAVYHATKSCECDWAALLDYGDLTFNVVIRADSFFSRDTNLIHSFSVRVKDAICDVLRDQGYQKPEPPSCHADADVPLFVTIHSRSPGDSAAEITFYRDLVGTSLHKRGYRANTALHRSALNESVAAGMLYFSGFTPTGEFKNNNPSTGTDDNQTKDGELLLVDPMCGSATLLIEAALLRLRVAVGLYRRERYPFEKWPDFERSDYEFVREAALEAQVKDDEDIGMRLIGNDINPSALRMGHDLVERMRLDSVIHLTQLDAADLNVDESSSSAMIVVSNPPWGRRIRDEEQAWTALGEFLKRHGQRESCTVGARAMLLSGDPLLTRGLRLKAKARHPVRIGNVDTRVIEYEVFPKKRAPLT